MTAPDAALPGLIGPYRVLGVLGRGGMGEVLLAHDPRLDREVAIKRIRAGGDPAARRRFQREARLAASLSHPAIVPVYDFVSLGEHDHLVMERIEGPSLRRWLDGEPDFAARLKVAVQVAAGLAFAHGRGVVHRDLKTENVLLTSATARRAAAKIADFGLALRQLPAGQPEGEEESRLTREGALVGTCRSMAPEQVYGEEADVRSDLFSFGVLLYELFAGESPFEAASRAETLRRLTREPHQPLEHAEPGLPPELSRLVDRLLEKEKDLRPQSAEEVLEDLERLLDERHHLSQDTLPPTPLPLPDQRLAPVSENRLAPVPDQDQRLAPVAPPDQDQRLASVAPPSEKQLAPVRDPEKHLAPVQENRLAPVQDPDKHLAPVAGKRLAPVPTAPVAGKHLAPVPDERLAPVPDERLAPVAGKRLAPVSPLAEKRLAPGKVAAIGAAVVLLLLAGMLLPWLGGGTPAGPLYAAVLPPRFEGSASPAGEAEQRLAFTVRSAALRQLSGLAGISPKNFDEIDQAGAEGPRQIAAAAGADELLQPTILCRRGDCQLRLERLRGGDGGLEAVEESELSLEDLTLAARSVQIAARRLYASFDERESRAGSAPIAAEDYSQLIEIRRELAAKPDSRRLDGQLGELRALRERSPGLVEAGWLEAEIAWRRFAETQDGAFRDRAREAMAAALAAAPRDPEVLLRSAWLAALDARPDDAEAALAEVEKMAPGDLRAIDQRALLLERAGRLEEALPLRREALERRPSWFRYYNLAFTAFQLSRWDEARATLDRLLAEAPGHGRALSLRARIELAGGDPLKAIERYSALLAKNESLLDRANLATAHLLAGNGAAAAAEIEKALAAAPANPYFLLSLADARSLEGRAEEAAELYRKVLRALEKQDDWQSLSVRAQAEARLGKEQEAFALLQQALRKAPADDRGMAMEAALVYSLLGDRTAALYHIRKMADWGWGGWLRLAPFAIWKDDPEIGPLLRQRGQVPPPS